MPDTPTDAALRPPVVMGVLNVTPDSFSDGGRYTTIDAAVAHGVRLRDDGAAIIDVGGESTRPGSRRVDPATEIARVLPVIRALAAAGVATSIDTTRAQVAQAALAAGASVVNDVSGGLADPEMAPLVAEAGCPWVLMHWRGHSRTMQQLATYVDVVEEVRAELAARVEAALAAGVAPGKIIVDPGLGFAKTAEHNWQLSTHIDRILDLGYPVLWGASRKSYLGALLAAPDGTPRPPRERDAATVATSILAVQAGAWGVRVHDVRSTADALAVLGRTARQRDRVTLTGLRATGHHGVLAVEREQGQEFVVDATLEVDLAPAAASDALADTIDYGALASILVGIVEGDPVDLIEALADRLVRACLADPRVRAASVTVHKPQAPIPHTFGDVSVTLRRSR